MTYVDDAFANLKGTLEITGTEQAFAKRKHEEIRSHVRESWDLADDFLTGSYRRHTKTKRLKDVDVFVVVDAKGAQGDLREREPAALLSDLEDVLRPKYDKVKSDGFACTVAFGPEDEVASFDVVPAFERTGSGWEIPDANRGRWIATNPKTHHEQSTTKNAECDEKFVPFVKMVKAVNREADEPIQPSFLLEVMAQSIVKPPFGRFQDEVRWYLATGADSVGQEWLDPAGIGPTVNDSWSSADGERAQAAFREWLEIAEGAVRLEDDGQERAAVEEWRRLFGWRMPRP
jgi:predicted nucleotidyltransferase